MRVCRSVVACCRCSSCVCCLLSIVCCSTKSDRFNLFWWSWCLVSSAGRKRWVSVAHQDEECSNKAGVMARMMIFFCCCWWPSKVSENCLESIGRVGACGCVILNICYYRDVHVGMSIGFENGGGEWEWKWWECVMRGRSFVQQLFCMKSS